MCSRNQTWTTPNGIKSGAAWHAVCRERSRWRCRAAFENMVRTSNVLEMFRHSFRTNLIGFECNTRTGCNCVVRFFLALIKGVMAGFLDERFFMRQLPESGFVTFRKQRTWLESDRPVTLAMAFSALPKPVGCTQHERFLS